MKKAKKSLAVLLAVIMLMSVLSFSALADTWSSVTDTGNTGLTISVSSGTEHLSIAAAASGASYDYVISSSITNYFPQSFSMQISNANATVTGTNGASFIFNNGTYGLVTMGSNSSILTVSYNSKSCTIYVPAPNYSGTTSSTEDIRSYIPAPGQFVNEGIGTGGWGEIHQSGSANLKNMLNGYCTTGVSLGAFGGSIVFDFGEDGIGNTASNKYGIDFIIYGNAFSTNAEPGCVQVAPDADGNGYPDQWYDIAGSLYYSGETVTMYYRDPTPTDNTNGTSTSAAVPYANGSNVTINMANSTQTWSSSSTIATNTFHNHSWFPLARNYFDGTERNATDYSTTASGDMANISGLAPASGTNPIKVMESQSVNNGTATTVISYSGRQIPWNGAGAGNYTFGYADVHSNGSNYGTASNPYAATASTSGGDGIDISWAVNPDGTPANLTNIRFVRIYTGVQQVTNFGEVSTEVCGVYAASGSGTGSAAAPTITVGGVSLADLAAYGASVTTTPVSSNQQIITITGASSILGSSANVVVSGGTYIFMNGDNISTKSVSLGGSANVIQIINQSGTAEPFITLLKVS